MEKLILDYITDYTIDYRIDKILLKNQEYIEFQEKVEILIKQIGGWDLLENENIIIDDLVSCCISQGTIYAKTAYQLGFSDCVTLLKELGICNINL